MRIVTIAKTLARQGDLVIIPRRDYEKLLELKKIREFRPTIAQRKALARAQRNLKKGKSLSYDAFTQAVGLAD